MKKVVCVEASIFLLSAIRLCCLKERSYSLYKTLPIFEALHKIMIQKRRNDVQARTFRFQCTLFSHLRMQSFPFIYTLRSFQYSFHIMYTLLWLNNACSVLSAFERVRSFSAATSPKMIGRAGTTTTLHELHHCYLILVFELNILLVRLFYCTPRWEESAEITDSLLLAGWTFTFSWLAED